MINTPIVSKYIGYGMAFVLGCIGISILVATYKGQSIQVDANSVKIGK